jgi:hypothetical protein
MDAVLARWLAAMEGCQQFAGHPRRGCEPDGQMALLALRACGGSRVSVAIRTGKAVLSVGQTRFAPGGRALAR